MSITKTKGIALALGIVAAAALSLPAMAAGVLTNGLPQVNPGTSYFAPNGTFTATGQSNTTYSGQLGGYELLPSDTGLGAGAQPQQVAASAFQIGAIAAAAALNPVVTTTTVSTNTTLGVMTLATPAIAAGATYTITMTNTSVLATSNVQAAAYLGTSTAGALQVLSITPAAGSVVFVLKNIGTAATNGTVNVPFQVK